MQLLFNSRENRLNILVIVSLLSFFVFCFPSKTKADLIPSGYHGVEYSFQIENIDSYSDYYFLLATKISSNWYSVQRIASNKDHLTFYKLSTPQIYAVKKSRFSKEIQKIEKIQRNLANDSIKKEQARLDNYFSNKNLIKSNVQIHSISAVPKNDPTEKVVDVFKVGSISKNNLDIIPVKVVYTYKDGKTEEKQYASPKSPRPLPTAKSAILTILWYLLPLGALVIILAIIISRKKRSGPAA